MRKILISFPGHGGGALFNAQARDWVLDPWVHLREVLRQKGIELLTADDHPVNDCERVWFWDSVGLGTKEPYWLKLGRRVKRAVLRRNPSPAGRNLYEECIQHGLGDRLLFFIGEPPAVIPRNWDCEIHALFPRILTWNDAYVDGRKFFKMYWPIAGRYPQVKDVPFSSRKLLVNISGNKHSGHPRELYSARRNTIHYFEHHHPETFDLFGIGWDSDPSQTERYSSYRGAPTHKWDVFPRYRFAVCYENMRDEPGWVTEKIFDCLRAGTVPIYWGASNVTEFVDEDAFVDRRRFKSEAELADYLLSMTHSQWLRYKEAGRAYLGTERFARFLPPAFAETVFRAATL